MTGFYSALIFSFHPFFITWNYAGFADTNAINLFFSLIIIFSALKYFKTQKHAWGVLALVTLIVFFKTWKGAFYIIVVLCFIAAVITIIKVKKPAYLLTGIAAFLSVLFLIYGDLIRNRLFPDTILFQTIKELKPVAFPELIQGLGGILMALITIAALILLIVKIVNKKDPWKYAALLAWFLPLCIAGILSRRFLYYAAPAIALSLGIFWQELRNKTISLFKNRKIQPLITLLLIIAIPILLWNSVNYLQQLEPFTNDAMVETMQFIKHATEENAIITTIAGKGYAYQYFSQRGTVIDTGKLTHARMYAVAEFFLEKDEEEARNILKQMNCGIDVNMTNIVCPPALVVVDENMADDAAVLQELSHFEQEIKMSNFQRHAGPGGDRLEQVHILDHQIHGEIDVTAAV